MTAQPAFAPSPFWGEGWGEGRVLGSPLLFRHPGVGRGPVALTFGVRVVATWLACRGLSNRCRGPSHFSLLAQRKVTKRKGTPVTRSTGLRPFESVRAGRAFRHDVPVVSKRNRHPWRPPCGPFRPALTAAQGTRARLADASPSETAPSPRRGEGWGEGRVLGTASLVRHSGVGRTSAKRAERPQDGPEGVSEANHPVTLSLGCRDYANIKRQRHWTPAYAGVTTVKGYREHPSPLLNPLPLLLFHLGEREQAIEARL